MVPGDPAMLREEGDVLADSRRMKLVKYALSECVGQWSQLLGRGLEPMGWAGQAFSPGPRYKPMWLAPNTNTV